MRLNAAPWTREKVVKKAGKQIIFFLIAVLVANTFLSYIIGVEEVIKIATEPVSANLSGFIAMLLFSGAFYFVFSYMREQVCIAICPYGRLQSVLLDKNSIVVAYDHVRGEPRGRIKKSKEVEPAAAPLGDCIACNLCVKVCPTGIDIRNGTQLECVNCTACIDACDEVMDKVERPRGLIRYDSLAGIEEKRQRIFTPRVIAYSAVLTVLLALNVVFLTGRTSVDTLILRTPGMLYQEVDETYISNLYNFQIINKTDEVMPITFRLASDAGRIKMVGAAPQTKPNDMVEGALFIEMERDKLEGRKNSVVIEVYSGDKLIDRITTNFLGPAR
jgi:cytochrome c oxidase accessory protein FixG